jgi:hypothetical protein
MSMAYLTASDNLKTAWIDYLIDKVDPSLVVTFIEKQIELVRGIDMDASRIGKRDRITLLSWLANSEKSLARARAATRAGADAKSSVYRFDLNAFSVIIKINRAPGAARDEPLFFTASFSKLLDPDMCWTYLGKRYDHLFSENAITSAMLAQLRWLPDATMSAASLLAIARRAADLAQPILVLPSPLVAGIPVPSEADQPLVGTAATTAFFDRWASGVFRTNELDAKAPTSERLFDLWLESKRIGAYVNVDDGFDARADLRALRADLKRFAADYFRMKATQLMEHTQLLPELAALIARYAGGQGGDWKAQWIRRAGSPTHERPVMREKSTGATSIMRLGRGVKRGGAAQTQHNWPSFITLSWNDDANPNRAQEQEREQKLVLRLDTTNTTKQTAKYRAPANAFVKTEAIMSVVWSVDDRVVFPDVQSYRTGSVYARSCFRSEYDTKKQEKTRGYTEDRYLFRGSTRAHDVEMRWKRAKRFGVPAWELESFRVTEPVRSNRFYQ